MDDYSVRQVGGERGGERIIILLELYIYTLPLATVESQHRAHMSKGINMNTSV